MANPPRFGAQKSSRTVALNQVHGAALGYQPFRMKPVHFATNFLLALTGRYYRLEYLNKASVPKTAPKDKKNCSDEYPSDRLYPLLIDRGTLDPSVGLGGRPRTGLQIALTVPVPEKNRDPLRAPETNRVLRPG